MASLGRNYSGPSLDPAEPTAKVILNSDSHANLEKTKYIRVSSVVFLSILLACEFCCFNFTISLVPCALYIHSSIVEP